MRARVIHFGNQASGSGGIASVIRGHLKWVPDSAAVTTYRQDASSAWLKNAPLLKALRELLGMPRLTIAHVHLSQRGSIVREGLLAIVAKISGKTVVVTWHGSSISSAGRVTRCLARGVNSCAHMVHGFSEVYRQVLEVPVDRWLTLPNAVECPGQVIPIEDRKDVVLFAGQLGIRKGTDILLEAWEQLSPSGWSLLLAGPVGPGAMPFLNRAETASNVVYLGEVEHENLLNLLRTAGILVQPSRAEAFPMSVCEALAAGTPVIASRAGAMGELVDAAGQMALDTIDATDLAQAISLVLEDPARRWAMSKTGAEYARVHLDASTVYQSWRLVYQRLQREA